VSRSWYGTTANAQSSFSLHALNYETKLPPPTTINCVFATLSQFLLTSVFHNDLVQFGYTSPIVGIPFPLTTKLYYPKEKE